MTTGVNMAGGEEVFVNYQAMEQLRTRLEGLAQAFSGVRRLPEVSATGAGDGPLAQAYEGFRSAWLTNRQEILQELQAAGSVLNEALVTYRTADESIAGTGAG